MFNESSMGLNNFKSENEGGNNSKENSEINRDYLMSVPQLDNIRRSPNNLSIEKRAILEGIDKRINEIVSSNMSFMFDKIIKDRKEGYVEKSDSGEAIDELLSSYPLDAKLITLPDNLLAEIMRPLNFELRQSMFVQRDKRTIQDALKLYKLRVKDTVVAYHVSSEEIENRRLVPGKNENAVYFSTDIERLFNDTSAKNIYAFRILKSDINSYRYGGLDCFGKMKTSDIRGVEIEGAISLYSKGDRNYRFKVLDSLGASFAKDYYAASDSANSYMDKKESA